MGCRAAPPQAGARGRAFGAPALAARVPVGAGSGSAGILLRAALSLRLTDSGLMGRAKHVRRAAGAGAASSVGCEFWREERLGSDLAVFRV